MVRFKLKDGKTYHYVPIEYTGKAKRVLYDLYQSTLWFYKGNLHRTTGPAVVYGDMKSKDYRLEGKFINKETKIVLIRC